MVQTLGLKANKKPTFREISFEGNMPSTYEKNLRKQLAKNKGKKPFT